jgi:putative flippase GtrA
MSVERKDHASAREGVIELVQSFIKYGLVGILTVATQAAIFLLLANVLRLKGLLSYAIAVAISLIVAYFGQSRWTFADRKSRSVVKYLLVVVLCFCVGSLSTWLIVDWGRLSPFWALPVMVFFIPTMSFLMLRAWAFR